MKDPLVDGMVDERKGRLEKFLRLGFVLGVDGGAKFADLMPQLRSVSAVDGFTLAGLLDALERRSMAGHRISFG